MSLLKDLLERKNYLVQYTSNGDQLLATVSEFKPELILLDVLHKNAIPGLKTNSEATLIPIILMTGYAPSEQSSELQVEDVIEKPFDFDLLQHKILQQLKLAV